MLKRVFGKLSRIKYSLDRKDPITGKKIDLNPNAIRLGNHLASWTIPSNLLSKDSICYFIGAGEDISFDIEVANRYQSQVFTFDPTPKAIAHFERLKDALSSNNLIKELGKETLNYLTFKPIGVWKENTKLKFFSPENPNHVSHSVVNLQNTSTYFEAEVKTIKSIMKEMEHDKVDIIKIDIEGAEYEVLKSIIQEQVFPKVLCIEFDEVFNQIDENYKSRINNSLNSLFDNGYEIFHLDYPGNYTLIRIN